MSNELLNDGNAANENEVPSGATPDQLDESGIHWVLCGGMQVGLRSYPKSWRLRPKDELSREAQRTKDLQRLANAARLIFDMHDAMTRYEMCVDESPTTAHRKIMERAEMWLNKNNLKP